MLDEARAASALSRRRARISRPRLIRIAIGVVVAVAVVFFGWRWLADRWAHVSVDDARVGTELVTVSSAVSDVVTEVPISAGDHVKPGELLIGISKTHTEAELRQIDATLAGVDAQVAQLKAQEDLVRAQITSKSATTAADLAGAEADQKSSAAVLANAKANFDRISSLHSRGVAAETEFDQAQATYLQAEQQALKADAGVRSAEASAAEATAEAGQLTVLDRQIAVLLTERTANEALRAQKVVDLEQREIRADFAGVIDATFINPGEFATPGQRLFIYHDPNTVWIDANVKETDIRNVKLNAPATVTVDAYPGRVFNGRVIEVGNAAESQFALIPSPNPSGNFTKITQRLPIKIAVDQVDDLLRPGMMVEASIDVVR